MENPCTNLCYVSRGKAYSYHVRKSLFPTAGISPTDGSPKKSAGRVFIPNKRNAKTTTTTTQTDQFLPFNNLCSLFPYLGRNQTDSTASVNNFDYGGYLYFLCLHRVLGTFLNLHSLYKKEDGRLFVRPNI